MRPEIASCESWASFLLRYPRPRFDPQRRRMRRQMCLLATNDTNNNKPFLYVLLDSFYWHNFSLTVSYLTFALCVYQCLLPLSVPPSSWAASAARSRRAQPLMYPDIRKNNMHGQICVQCTSWSKIGQPTYSFKYYGLWQLLESTIGTKTDFTLFS